MPLFTVEKTNRNIDVQDINGQKLSIKQLSRGFGGKYALASEDSVGSLSSYFETLRDYLPENVNLNQNFTHNVAALKAHAEERHSIFPIKKAMFFYTSRLVNGLSGEEESKKQAIVDQIFNDLSEIIDADIARFLNTRPSWFERARGKKAYEIRDINAYINKNRKKYALLAEGLVASKLAVEEHALVDKQVVKKYFKKRTAVDIDIVETNDVTGIMTHTSGVKDSSHSKKTRPPAITAIKKYVMDASENWTLIQTQYRTPSLVEAELTEKCELFSGVGHDSGILTVEEQVKDFVSEVVKDREEKSRLRTSPVIYNLLTSLSPNNDQDKTAKLNFLAMHAYNKSKQEADPYYYVMNVPINQHGEKLSLSDGSSLAKEAAFFSDLAMLETLPAIFRNESEPSGYTQHIKTIKTQYKAFLDNPESPAYFCESTQWLTAKNSVAILKNTIAENIDQIAVKTNEKKLWKVYLKLHLEALCGEMTHQKELSSLIQGIFLALNDNDNLKGCKSAVDRFTFAESINNLFLAYLKGNPNETKMKEELSSAIDGYAGNNITTEQFAVRIHEINNKYKAYDSSIDSALNDANDAKHITAPSRLKMSGELGVATIDTNKFVPSIYTNIQQSNAPYIQAEKAACKRAIGLRQTAENIKSRVPAINSSSSPSTYKKMCIQVLSEYANSWSLRKHHRQAVQTTIYPKRLGFRCNLIQIRHSSATSIPFHGL